MVISGIENTLPGYKKHAPLNIF